MIYPNREFSKFIRYMCKITGFHLNWQYAIYFDISCVRRTVRIISDSSISILIFNSYRSGAVQRFAALVLHATSHYALGLALSYIVKWITNECSARRSPCLSLSADVQTTLNSVEIWTLQNKARILRAYDVAPTYLHLFAVSDSPAGRRCARSWNDLFENYTIVVVTILSDNKTRKTNGYYPFKTRPRLIS